MTGRLKISTADITRSLLAVDILRAMIISPLLVGLFCGASTVLVHKLPEKIMPNNDMDQIDYYRNREVMIGCMVIGLIFCGVDILLALAMEKILSMKLRRAGIVWMTCSTAGICLRSGFYTCLWNNEIWLGFTTLSDLTSTLNLSLRIIFVSAAAYEFLKVIQLVVGLAAQMEWIATSKRRTPAKK